MLAFSCVVTHVRNYTIKMAANCASIKQHLETFIKHVEELRQTDDDDVDGFEKEYKVSVILLQNLYDCVWECICEFVTVDVPSLR